jgi:hypothetical protein
MSIGIGQPLTIKNKTGRGEDDVYISDYKVQTEIARDQE